MVLRILRTLSLLLGVSLPLYTVAATVSLESILALTDTPAGVVFEVVEGDAAALVKLLPRIKQQTRQLRLRYPGLAVAVVSHGREQFSLVSEDQSEYSSVHRGVQDLLAQQVPVHVCGAHAGFYGLGVEDYPDYVDVSPSGPAQINDYKALGYRHIVLEMD